MEQVNVTPAPPAPGERMRSAVKAMNQMYEAAELSMAVVRKMLAEENKALELSDALGHNCEKRMVPDLRVVRLMRCGTCGYSRPADNGHEIVMWIVAQRRRDELDSNVRWLP